VKSKDGESVLFVGEKPRNKLIHEQPSGTVKTACDYRYIQSIWPEFNWYIEGGDYYVGVQTKRGCPHNCCFCVYTVVEGKQVRVNPVDEVIKEMKQLYDLGVRGFWFTDAQFIPAKKHIADAKERVILTTFASSVHRVTMILELAMKHGRKVGLLGRSMINVIAKARDIGYMKCPDDLFVPIKQIRDLPDRETLLLMTGSQGEPLAALSRISRGEHQHVRLKTTDTVIFSASPIPGNTIGVVNTIDRLMKMGAKVVYGKGENIHVSGHGFQEDQKLMLALAKPKFFVPVHGEHRMLVCHSKSAQTMGVPKDNILIIENGDVVELTSDSINKGDPVKAGVELLDNSRNGIVDARVLKERQQLAGDGVVTVLAPISTDGKMVAPPRVNLRGVVTTAEPRKMSMWTEREISWVLENRWKQLSRQTGPNNFEVDWIGVQREIENGLSRRMRRELQVEPLILCLVQPAPSGTRAYIPKITEEQNFSNRNRNNNNFHKKSNNNHPNSSNNLQNTQKSQKVSQNPPAETLTEDSFEGRTRRRRSAVTS